VYDVRHDLSEPTSMNFLEVKCLYTYSGWEKDVGASNVACTPADLMGGGNVTTRFIPPRRGELSCMRFSPWECGEVRHGPAKGVNS
jgi:hypothetical protein